MSFPGAQVCKPSATPSVYVHEADGTWNGIAGWYVGCTASHLSEDCDGCYSQRDRMKNSVGDSLLGRPVREFLDCVS